MATGSGNLTGTKRVLNDLIVKLINFSNDFNTQSLSATKALENLCNEVISFDQCCRLFQSTFCRLVEITEDVQVIAKSVTALSELNPGDDYVYPDRQWSYKMFGDACGAIVYHLQSKIKDWKIHLEGLKLTNGKIELLHPLILCLAYKDMDRLNDQIILQMRYEANL